MRVELPQLAGARPSHICAEVLATALSDGTRVDTASPHNGAHSAGTQLLSAHGAGAMPGSASPRIGVQRDLKMSSSAGGEDDDENDALIERSGGDASPGGEKPGGPSALYEGAVTVAYCVVYLLVGPALILTNKQIMRDVGFHFPMMVSGIGQASSAICSLVAIRVLGIQPLANAHLVSWHFYLRNMMVVGAATAASLCFGNAGYLFLTVSFVQILKAFTPVFVVAMLYCTAIETPSRRVVGAVIMICVGTSLASAGEAHFNATGLLIMFCAETCEATRLVLTQKLLTNLKFPALEGLYYMAPICAFWMFGLAAILEMPRAISEGAFALVPEHPRLFASAFFCGFAVNVASFLVIKRTNSVMLKLMGTARNAGLAFFSAAFLGDEMTGLQLFGYAVCLFFFGAYNYFKMYKL